MTEQEPVELEMRYIRESNGGRMIAFSLDEKFTSGTEKGMEKYYWLPKSIIQYERKDQRGDICIVTIPRWLAEDRELV